VVTDLAPTPRPVLGRTFAAVLFDMDGTLISSVESVVRSWTRLAEEFRIPAERFGDFHGIPARDLLDVLLPDRPPAERQRALERITELEISDVAGVRALPGAEAALAAANGRCAVVTSSNRALARARLEASGLPTSSVLVTADDVTLGKPAPEPFVLAAARLGVDVVDCLVVEDATAGIIAGRAAGASTLGLTTTTERIVADLVVPDLSAVRLTAAPGGVLVAAASASGQVGG